MWKYRNKTVSVVVFLLFLLSAIAAPRFAEAAVVEADPDLQLVMGDLCALSVAMRLYYEDTHKTQCPTPEQLAHYFRKTPTAGDYQTAEVGGAWWVGRKVPEFSRARSFMRTNAEAYGLYDRTSMGHWLGGSFVWRKAVGFTRTGGRVNPDKSLDLRVVQGDGRDNQHLFFNIQGTDRYWWSDLLYTTGAHADALKLSAPGADKGPFVIPQAPQAKKENIVASPVSVPDDFTVGRSSDDITDGIDTGGNVLFNPMPRMHDNSR